MKKTLMILLVVLFTILSFLNTNVQSNAYAQQNLTPIMGQSHATKAQAFQLLRNNNSAKSDAYIQEFVDITWEEAAIEGVRADVAFSLMMLETGYLKFGGRVQESQNNFGGIGATDSGGTPASFNSINEGIRAVVQHLKAYACSDILQSECVDPRFHLVKRGCAKYVEWLGIQENPEGRGWASGYCYGYRIINVMNQMSGKLLIPVITNLTVTCSNSTYSITATASYESQPLYKFVATNTATNQQTIIQDYSKNNKATWTPSSAGNYKIMAYIKNPGSQYEFDAYTTYNVKLVPTTINSFTLDKTDIYAGKPFTATVNATSKNKPLYEFWIGKQTANGNWSWTRIQNYGEKNTVTYTVNDPAKYKLCVNVKDSTSTKPVDVSKLYDVTVKLPFTVVLDAGHGGIDPGAESSPATGKIKEAELNEQLTRILGKLLETYGINVIYTRDNIPPRDKYMTETQDLKNRVKVANNAGADLFLSIHHNSFSNPSAKGVETYYCSSKQSSETVKKSSEKLAKQIVNNIASLGFVNRGHKDGNYYVIKYTTMPAVLIEVGFMTNDEEVLRLANPKTQQSVAEKIAEAVKDYLNQSNSPVISNPVISNVDRIVGNNRYETAVKVSQAGWPTANTVILARGDDYADALAGVPLAHQLNAPILLTQTNNIEPTIISEIKRLGAKQVILLGGPGAISDSVKKELERHNLTAERIAGGNRYETAALIAERMAREGAIFETAFIAVGTNFADALAASSYAAIKGQPILLTETNSLPQPTENAIKTLGIKNTVVCGGSGAVSESVFTKLPNSKRVSGNNRYLTALELAKEFMPECTNHVYVATGLNFPDAIAGGVLAAKHNSGVLLVQGNQTAPSQQMQDFITTHAITDVTIFGGTTIVSGGLEEWFKNNLR